MKIVFTIIVTAIFIVVLFNKIFHRLEEIKFQNLIQTTCDENATKIDWFNEYPESLCEYLCNNSLEVVRRTDYLHKTYVFTVQYKDIRGRKFVLKAVSPLHTNDDEVFNQKNNATAVESIETMILLHTHSILGSSLQHSLNHVNISLLNLNIRRYEEIFRNSEKSFSSHENAKALIWRFLSDHEFYTSFLFRNYNYFPKIIGVCDDFYAVEYASPLIGNPLFLHLIPLMERLEKAIYILILLREIQLKWIEPIHLCDMKPDHFGIIGKKVKFLDLDCVVTDSSLKSIMVSTPSCVKDEDCSYFDCMGQCSQGRCSEGRKNTNLQVLCGKIFLGYYFIENVSVFGLLSHGFSGRVKNAVNDCLESVDMSADYLLNLFIEEYGTLKP